MRPLDVVAALCLIACLWVCVATWRSWRTRLAALAGVLLVVASAYAMESRRLALHSLPKLALRESVVSGGPRLSRDSLYVSSDKCQACHVEEYESWHRTYHRTMTQLALPENVLSDFQETTVDSRGLRYRVYREGDTFWAEMPDPDYMMLVVQGGKDIPLESIRRVKRQIVMTTGSHHYQTFWVRSGKFDTVLQTLPLVYLPDKRQWIPREDAFLQPADSERMITQWNTHCIKCHSTGGVPGVKGPQTVQTEVGELGIACEACHGPAERHVAANHSPLRRYQLHLSGLGDDTIVNPAKLDHRKSSEVCGQCHGLFTAASNEAGLSYARKGSTYRPGGDLSEERYYINFPTKDSPADVWENYRKNPEFFKNSWWDDGTILVGGREHTAMSSVPCVTKGEMSCLSCHSMHHSDPNDQLKPGMRGSQACVQCHNEPIYTDRVAEHTHHLPDSSGSNCLNCHMPHTTYALFSGIRNHTINSPTIAASVQHATPNACNLCHLDQTLAWTQERLVDWYGHKPLEIDEEQRSVAASLLWMIKGNAALRIITAWHFGWSDAQKASGTDWPTPFLAQLLQDPYGAVRHVAWNSLEDLRGPLDAEFNFLGSAEERGHAVVAIQQQWDARKPRFGPDRGATLLMLSEGGIDGERLARILSERDDTPVRIAE